MGRKRWFMGRRTDPDTLRGAIAYDPQSSLADIVNQAMLRTWHKRDAILMMNDHDALTFMYPEEKEDEIIPKIKSNLEQRLPLNGGRELCIPYDCEVGWNKGHYDPIKNPEGLKGYKGHDTRKREVALGILDRPLKRA